MTTTETSAARRALACTLLDRLAAVAPSEQGRAGRTVELEGAREQDYLLGFLDALALLGAVKLSDDGGCAAAVSPQAGWLLRILADILDTGAPLVADWEHAGLSHAESPTFPFGKATDLLASLDARRRELLPQAAPVREVEAAVALIARPDEHGARRLLCVYDEDARAWQLPGGRREVADPSVEATLLRELGEELGLPGLRVPRDLSFTRLMPLVSVRDSPSYGVRTRTRIYPFLVSLWREPGAAAETRWLGAGELLAGRTGDGHAVAAGPAVHELVPQMHE